LKSEICNLGRQDSFDLAYEIIREGLDDTGFHPVARFGLPFQEDAAINLRSLGLESSSQDPFLTIRSFHQDLHSLAHHLMVLFEGDLFLESHQGSQTFFLHGPWDRIGKPGSSRSFFGGIFEDSEMIELNFLNEVTEGLEMAFPLPWKSNDQGGPETDSWQGVLNPVE
jgi:hypothetical protein